MSDSRDSRDRFEKEYPVQDGVEYNEVGNYYAQSYEEARQRAVCQQYRWQGWQACEASRNSEVEKLTTENANLTASLKIAEGIIQTTKRESECVTAEDWKRKAMCYEYSWRQCSEFANRRKFVVELPKQHHSDNVSNSVLITSEVKAAIEKAGGRVK